METFVLFASNCGLSKVTNFVAVKTVAFQIQLYPILLSLDSSFSNKMQVNNQKKYSKLPNIEPVLIAGQYLKVQKVASIQSVLNVRSIFVGYACL
jgi:hypothetical protein